jgi:tetratricopeptide (TPR) repeat protein
MNKSILEGKMKEVKGLFSRLNKGLKPFVTKIKSIFKPINRVLISICKKISNKYKQLNSKNKYIEPIVVIVTSCLFVLMIILGIKNFTTVEEISITSNQAEYLYYENKYDEAIEEYKKMQDEDNWPIWTAKIADIYSLIGETDKASTLLKESIIKRDKIVKDEGYDKYKEKDVELINSILFTFTLNKEYDEAISLGNQYMDEYGSNKNILKTLFLAYIANNHTYKAEEVTENYLLDEESAYDISELASMNMMINRLDNGIELLKKAWLLDKNELKIYNVLESMYMFDKDSLINVLEEKLEESNEDVYKIFLAKAYSMSKDTSDKALNITNELDDEGISNIGTDLIKFEVYKSLNNLDEASYYLDEAINKSQAISKNSYTTYYLLSLKSINNAKYDEALNYAKKSINVSSNNADSYGVLIPQILINKQDFNYVETYYRTALQKEPYNYELIINLADYYVNILSNDTKARYYYELALDISKYDSSLYLKIFDLDIKEGKIDEAIAKLEEAIKFDEENPVYYRTLGALYLEQGMNEEGIELTRKAYSMDEKDSITLNNAGWYYLMVENDIARGYDNIKGAYDGISASLDEDTKKIIIDNYNNAKKVYEEFLSDGSQEFDLSGISLIY